MQSSTTYSRGDIVLVPFTFSDSEGFKRRPALVLSTPAFHAGRADVVVAALTTQIRMPLLSGDYRIENFEACGLPKPSVVTGILRTVKGFMIIRTIGALPREELRSYDQILRRSLGL